MSNLYNTWSKNNGGKLVLVRIIKNELKQKDFTAIVPELYMGKEIELQASVDLKDDNDAKG